MHIWGYLANTVTLQGQTVSVGGDGKGLRQLPEPRHPSGRVP